MTYTIRYSEEAAVKRDSLDPARRKAFERAVAVIAEHPDHEKSIEMGENVRHIRLTQSIVCEYVVFHQFVMIMVLNVFDSGDILVTEED